MKTINNLDVRNTPQEIIDKTISKFITDLTSTCEQKFGKNFHWIVDLINLTAPDFQLLCFRINQCVFSCRIAIIDDDIKYENGTWQFMLINNDNYCGDDERLRMCKNNNLTPTVIVLDVKGKQEPAFAIDGGNYLEPFELEEYVENNSTKGEWSLYELRIASRSIILDFLHEQGITIQAISEMPEMQPAIYCTDIQNNNIAIIDSIIVNCKKINTWFSEAAINTLINKGYIVWVIYIEINNEVISKTLSRGDTFNIQLKQLSIFEHPIEKSKFSEDDSNTSSDSSEIKTAEKSSIFAKIKNLVKKLY